ncbi:MAG: hypothetical protein CMO55_27645 [Verrucomicrobiales bacterium]|nr:hypothetical protein [Verrucomicrobiales bacterium]
MRVLTFISFLFVGFSVLAQEASPVQQWKDIITSYYAKFDEAEGYDGIKIPLLACPDLEKKWGQPKVFVAEDGSYRLMYTHPSESFERVDVYGYAIPLPVLTNAPAESVDTMVNGELGTVERPQTFKDVTVKIPTPAGNDKRDVQYFREYSGGGADGPMDSTNTLTFTVNGVTGYYVVKVESVSKATKKFLKQIELVR